MEYIVKVNGEMGMERLFTTFEESLAYIRGIDAMIRRRHLYGVDIVGILYEYDWGYCTIAIALEPIELRGIRTPGYQSMGYDLGYGNHLVKREGGFLKMSTDHIEIPIMTCVS